MSKSNKPQWTAMKYMGDDSHSWAIVDKRYLPKGHRGPIFNCLPTYAVFASGLTSQNKSYYLKIAKEKTNQES